MSPADDYTHGPWSVLLAVALGLAVVGFFAGTADDRDQDSPLRSLPDTTALSGTELAPSYQDRRTTTPRPVDGFSDGAELLARVDATGPSGAKGPALAERAELRAFNGAPPRIPHPFDMGEDGACLACHQDGLAFGERTASPMSHDTLSVCTQCHVAGQDLIPGGDDLEVGLAAVPNSFNGLQEPLSGDRAWSIAPPAVPHTTWMRENCNSCHGPFGRDPLETPHPERQSCTQCHALSDAYEQGASR